MVVRDQDYRANRIDLTPLTEEEKRYFEIIEKFALKPGCICPPTSEQTCQSPMCPRRNIFGNNQ